MKGKFHWPDPIGHVPIAKFVEPPEPGVRSKNVPLGTMPTAETGKANVRIALRKNIKKGINPFEDVDLFGDIACSAKFLSWMNGKVPCMLHSHPQGPWSIKRGRFLTIQERGRPPS